MNKKDGKLFTKNSTMTPKTLKETHHMVETFIEAFKNALQKEAKKRKKKLPLRKI